LFITLILFCILSSQAYAKPTDKLVTSMPLMNDGKNFTFGMYAGHINVVPEESQDKIFYIFVES